jgi:hypothetical protein
MEQSDIDKHIDVITTNLKYQIGKFQKDSSAWKYRRTLGIYINTNKYIPLMRSSCIDLLGSIKIPNQLFINVKNKDDKCFMWSVLAHLYPTKDNPQRVTKYV